MNELTENKMQLTMSVIGKETGVVNFYHLFLNGNPIRKSGENFLVPHLFPTDVRFLMTLRHVTLFYIMELAT